MTKKELIYALIYAMLIFSAASAAILAYGLMR